MMILTGSFAMVITNRDNAGPYAVSAHPKNARTVILNFFTLTSMLKLHQKRFNLFTFFNFLMTDVKKKHYSTDKPIREKKRKESIDFQHLFLISFRNHRCLSNWKHQKL